MVYILDKEIVLLKRESNIPPGWQKSEKSEKIQALRIWVVKCWIVELWFFSDFIIQRWEYSVLTRNWSLEKNKLPEDLIEISIV